MWYCNDFVIDCWSAEGSIDCNIYPVKGRSFSAIFVMISHCSGFIDLMFYNGFCLVWFQHKKSFLVGMCLDLGGLCFVLVELLIGESLVDLVSLLV